MADVTIPGLTALTSIDRAADLFEVSDTSDSGNSKKTTVNNMLNITSQPMGLTDSQSPTNKTFDNTNIFTIRDDRLTLQDNSDITKQAVFQLSGITTGTTRTYTLPNVSDTLVSLTASQTLTNKTLTSPTISAPTITNPTITVDTISEFTAANGVTIDGLNIKDSKLNTANSVVTSNITNAAVTADKLGLNPQQSYLATDQGTTSTSYVDLATVQSVTATIGANGVALVTWSAGIYNVAASKRMSVAVSGATTLAASDDWSIRNDVAAFQGTQLMTHLFTGLTPGSNTFTLKFKTASGTAQFFERNLLVVPL